MSLANPWNLTVAPTPTATAPSPTNRSTELRKPTMQEIMDEEFARQLYEDDCRAMAALVSMEEDDTTSTLFDDLEDKPHGRELYSADSFFSESGEDSGCDATTTSSNTTRASWNRSPPTKSKQGFDRSLAVEGADRGLNSIRESFRRREKDERHGRVERAKFATHDAVLDERTTRLLQKLINRGDLDQVFGCVQSGKEANVYFATGTDPETFQRREYAVKIFKTTLNTFANRKDYITGDRRFDLAFQKKDRRRQIHEWSEKEFRNLSRVAAKCGATVRVPEVIAVKEHIVVMRFLGDPAEGLSAPTLKEIAASLTASQLIHAYADLLHSTRELFQRAKLVHGDLSEYNVLYHKQKCWLIDFGQAVDLTHPQALEFLHRDLATMRRFFEKHGLADAALAQGDGLAGLLTTDEAFEWVCAPRESDARHVLGDYKQLHKLDDCRAMAALVSMEEDDTTSTLFDDLEDKPHGRELYSADSFFSESGEDNGCDATTTSSNTTRVSWNRSPPTKSKQGFDRSLAVEGADRGLNSIRESFRRREKDERHGRVERAKFATHDA